MSKKPSKGLMNQMRKKLSHLDKKNGRSRNNFFSLSSGCSFPSQLKALTDILTLITTPRVLRSAPPWLSLLGRAICKHAAAVYIYQISPRSKYIDVTDSTPMKGIYTSRVFFFSLSLSFSLIKLSLLPQITS